MSYFCIYQNKFINLGDKIAMLWRAGCNNDDEGREKNVYNRIFVKTKQELIDEALENLKCPSDESWGMKVGTKYINNYQYGEWLLKGIKNALSVDSFNEKYWYNIKSFDYLEDVHTGEKYYKGDTERYFKQTGNLCYRLYYKDLELDDIDKASYVSVIKRRVY